MRKFKLFVMAAVVFSVFLVPDISFARLVKEWQDSLNISVTGGSGVPYGYGYKASDGSLFAYYSVTGPVTNIYVQKIDKNGQKLWGEQGRFVDQAQGWYGWIVDLAPDNNGGTIAVWLRLTVWPDFEIRAKRFDSSGNEDPSWGPDGVLIGSNARNHAIYNAAVFDGTGGAIVVFNVGGDWSDTNIYAQRVGSDGQLKWNNGEPVYVGDGFLYSGWTEANNMVSDGNGGVFIAWKDSAGVSAQHLDSNGSPQLPYGGLIALTPGKAMKGLIPDSTGGVIITAGGSGYGLSPVIAQRVDSMGNLPWGSDGIVVKSVSCWGPRTAFIESVGNGEFVVVWDGMEADPVSCEKMNVYAQKIDINGNLKWALEGVIVSEQGRFNSLPHVTTDGTDGVWISFINGKTASDIWNGNGYIGVQHVDNAGNLFACTPIRQKTHNKETWDNSIVPDDEGGAYSLWDGVTDYGDVYAQRFGRRGARQQNCNN
jgi:hypothetical protein